MKIKRQELFGLLKAFETVNKLPSAKFAYALLKNQDKILNEVKTFNQDNQIKTTKEYNDFETARIKLCTEHCAKENGKPVIKDNKFVGLAGHKEFKKKLEDLQEKYKEDLIDYQKQIDSYDAKLQEEIEFEIFQIDKKELPENINAKQLEAISVMVKEDNNV